MAGSDGRSPPAASNFRADASDPVELVQSISNVSRMVWQPNRTDGSTLLRTEQAETEKRERKQKKFRFIYRRHKNSDPSFETSPSSVVNVDDRIRKMGGIGRAEG